MYSYVIFLLKIVVSCLVADDLPQKKKKHGQGRVLRLTRVTALFDHPQEFTTDIGGPRATTKAEKRLGISV